MVRKIMSAALIIALCCGLMGSCSKEPEEGTIDDVVIEQPEPDKDTDSIFTKTDSPYDYDYSSFVIRKAHMRFDIPKSWNADFINARYVVIQTPADDRFLPDTTISILCNYGEDVDENEMSQYTLNNHAYNFSEFFKNELEGLPTYTGGMNRHLRMYVAEDEIRNGLDFVDKSHAEDAATLVADKVVLVDNTNKYYTNQYGMVSSYVKWDHSPICFNAIVDRDKIENAVNMIEHIVSSITYERSDFEGYKEVGYKDFITYVPNSFMPVDGAENVFVSSLKENKESAGISIGVFTVDSDSKDSVTASNIADYYGQTIASLSFGIYSSGAAFGMQTVESEDEDGPDFTGTLGVDCSGYSEATEIAGSVFGPYAYYLCDYYVTEKNDKIFLISVIYQECQKELARAAGKTALRKLRVS